MLNDLGRRFPAASFGASQIACWSVSGLAVSVFVFRFDDGVDEVLCYSNLSKLGTSLSDD